MKTPDGDESDVRTTRTPPAQLDVAALWLDFAHKVEDGARAVLAGNEHDIADAKQTVAETLLKMHQRGTLTPRTDWAAYLYRAGRNAALNIVGRRGAARVPTVPLTESMDAGWDETFDPRIGSFDPVGDRVVAYDDGRALRSAMDQLGLDHRQRRIIVGAFIDGMTDAELGREFGVSGQRVGVLRRDLQLRLARLLTNHVRGGEHP